MGNDVGEGEGRHHPLRRRRRSSRDETSCQGSAGARGEESQQLPSRSSEWPRSGLEEEEERLTWSMVEGEVLLLPLLPHPLVVVVEEEVEVEILPHSWEVEPLRQEEVEVLPHPQEV